jgi:hypothetical protein
VQFETFRIWFSLIRSDLDADRMVSDEGGKVRIADKAGHEVTLTFDPATGLPQTETYPAPGNPNGSVMETYGDWQESNGVKLPHKITLIQEGHHYGDIAVKSISLNQGLTAEQISKKP